MKNTELRVDGVPRDESNPTPTPSAGSPADEATADADQTIHEKIVAAVSQVHDPEIPVNIYELGLIYDINVDPQNNVIIKMTLTSPACPVAESLPGEVRAVVGRVPEVAECQVDLVWEPTWGPDNMSDVAKLKLGML